MLNKLFFIMNERGEPVAQGKVGAQLSPGIYSCTIAGNPPVGRIIAAENMQNFNFFDDEDHMADWMRARAAAQAAQNAPPLGVDDLDLSDEEEELAQGLAREAMDLEESASVADDIHEFMDEIANLTDDEVQEAKKNMDEQWRALRSDPDEDPPGDPADAATP